MQQNKNYSLKSTIENVSFCFPNKHCNYELASALEFSRSYNQVRDLAVHTLQLLKEEMLKQNECDSNINSEKWKLTH